MLTRLGICISSACAFALLLSLASECILAAGPPADEKGDRDVRNIETSRSGKKHHGHGIKREQSHFHPPNAYIETKIVTANYYEPFPYAIPTVRLGYGYKK